MQFTNAAHNDLQNATRRVCNLRGWPEYAVMHARVTPITRWPATGKGASGAWLNARDEQWSNEFLFCVYTVLYFVFYYFVLPSNVIKRFANKRNVS